MSDHESTATSRVKDADAIENTTKISSATSAPDKLADATTAAEPAPTVADPGSEVTVEEPPSVRDIFMIPEKPTDVRDDCWQTFQEKLAEEAKGIKWTAAMPDLGAKICELLDIKLHDVLLTAWKKVEALRQVLEDSKKDPEKSSYLDLTEHSIDYETAPFIDVKIKGASVKKLTLHVALNLKLKAFVLKIQNGAIREIQTGTCEAKGTIEYEKLTIAEKKLSPIKFPLTIRVPNLFSISEPAAEEEAQPSESSSPKPEVASVQPDDQKPTAPVERIEL